MKHFLKTAATLLFVSCSAYGERLNNYLDFYIGADAQLRDMRFKNGFGDNLLKKKSPQGNVYVGIMLNDYSAFEIGYESTMERACTATLQSGECSAGVIVPPAISPATFRTKSRIKGAHFNLVGFYPLENWNNFKLLGGIGVSSLKGTVERKTIEYSSMKIRPGTVRTMKKHKATLRFMGGLQYEADCGLGFRTTVSLIRTGKLVIKKDDDHPSVYVPMIKPKDSIVYGVGTFWAF
jgi:hypothetical protein